MIEQGSEEWFELRRGLATGSHFNAVMAKGRGGEESTERRNYKFRLALEIVTGRVIAESFGGNRHTERGKELEPFARMAYESMTGDIVTEVPFIRHKFLQAGVSPDGLVGDDGMVEFKCPIPAIHWGYMNLPDGTPPDEYKWQVYGELWVSGRQWNDFVSYCQDMPGPLQISVNRVHRNQAIIDQLDFGVTKFMAEVNLLAKDISARAEERRL